MREEELIGLAGKYFSPGLRAGEISRGIGDDCAVVRFDGRNDLVITCDTLCEGTHFLKGTPSEKVARKLLAVNLSDVAAMGGEPWLAVLSFAAPRGIPDKYARAFFAALGKEAEKFGLAIVGGDCVASKTLTLTLTLLGKVRRGRALLRSGARENDMVFVTGRLGGTLKSGRHLSFEPRLAEARWLAKNFRPSAMMDLSDGLLEDGGKLARASSLTMDLRGGLVPRAEGCGLREALTGGEDFELLLTVPAENFSERKRTLFQKKFGLELSLVGAMIPRGGADLLLDGKKPAWRGYAHFGV